MDGAPTTAAPGSRRRAGNAMGRARAAILLGARQALAESGPRGLTMSGVATRGGVAKATVYNHFRDRQELVAGLAVEIIDQLAAEAATADGLPEALAAVAGTAAAMPEIRAAVGHDPAVAAALLVPSDTSPWRAANEAVVDLLDRHRVPDPVGSAPWVMRWLAGAAVAAPDPASLSAEAGLTAAALSGAAVTRG